jgi:hypothetical protein
MAYYFDDYESLVFAHQSTRDLHGRDNATLGDWCQSATKNYNQE